MVDAIQQSGGDGTGGPPNSGDKPRLLVVSVGHTNATASLTRGATLDKPRRFPLDDLGAVADGLVEMAGELAAEGADDAAVVFSWTNRAACDTLASALAGRTELRTFRLMEDLTIPIRHALQDEAVAKTGQDRLLNALAAFDAAKQAVVVVDAGTAITVDFIDGKGVFQGGAIAPGAGAGLRALHSMTTSLPELKAEQPDDEPFGRDTRQAMLQGMKYGAQGLVRRLVERYAEAYDAYPMVVATGGDAGLLFDDDELVDRVVPHLTLRGIALACVHELGEDGGAGGTA